MGVLIVAREPSEFLSPAEVKDLAGGAATLLEQLRVLWYGEKIHVAVAKEVPGTGVDTPEDLERVRAELR